MLSVDSALDRWSKFGAMAANAAIVVHAPDTTILWTNEEAVKQLGIPHHQLRGKTAPDPSFRFLDESRRTLSLEEYPVSVVLSTGRPMERRIVGSYPPGSDELVWFQVYAAPVFEENQLAAVVVTFIDVTDLQDAQERVAAREERLAFAISGTSEGLWDVNLTTNTAWYSPRFCELLGEEPDAVEGTIDAWSERIHPADLPRVEKEHRLHVEGGHPFDCRYRMRHASGQWRWYRSRARTSVSDAGEPLRTAGSIADITPEVEREAVAERARARLEESAKLESVGLLTSGIAHDFNNLLVGVLGAVDVALASRDKPAQVEELLGVIKEAATAGSELTQQLMAFAGRGVPVIERLDILAILDELVRLTRPSLTAHIDLHHIAGEEVPDVEMNATDLRRIVLNLITNAIEAVEATQGGSRVEVLSGCRDLSAEALRELGGEGPPGTYATIEVVDDGIGMDPETCARIFTLFFSTKKSGHGLGLSAVHGLLRANGGYITVESRPRGGSRFEVGLPAAAPSVAARSLPPERKDTTRFGGTVLLVDDDAAVLRAVGQMLAMLGFEVHQSPDGDALAELVERLDPRLVVLDLIMPGHGGDELLKMLRARWPRLPVLLSSGHADLAERVRIDPHEPTTFIAKPFTTDGLRARLMALLASAADGGGE